MKIRVLLSSMVMLALLVLTIQSKLTAQGLYQDTGQGSDLNNEEITVKEFQVPRSYSRFDQQTVKLPDYATAHPWDEKFDSRYFDKVFIFILPPITPTIYYIDFSQSSDLAP